VSIEDFASRLPFEFDDFQREAIEALDAGESVLVAAPTGSGKTVVAEYACSHALAAGAKCFYTTPLKALSNQKFGDLIALHHARNVGLLTGDNSINGEAPLVVMTTEVLRNMLYEGSHTLRGLRFVVLDEVHYLQDPYRGAVWEEVLIHLPPEVRVVCLSATISNVDEFGDWLRTLRGDVRVVVERKRPVELRNLVLVAEELHPLLGADGQASADLARVWAHATTAASRYGHAPAGRPGYRGGNRAPGRPRQRGPSSDYTPTRVEVARVLARERMLPAICFIFSRAGCDAAVESCVLAGVDLTTHAEARRIEEFALLRASDVDEEDLSALRFDAFLEGLRAGVAAHHAGMLPIFKETVEELFALGLLKLVFATETLSLGINMPARTVVIERLTKFTGEKHEMLTPTDYTQLTGRAGRRGIDDLGYAVTLFDPWVPLSKLASLATVRAYKLTSSFRLSYNMAVNLVRRHDRPTATRVLNSSFAQFDADRSIVRLERELAARTRQAEELRGQLACDVGDAGEYAELRREAAEAMSSGRGTEEVRAAVATLVPGDVIWAERLGRAVVLEQPRPGSGGAPRLTVMTTDRKLRRLGPRDFRAVPVKIGRLGLRGHSWRAPKVRRTLARELEAISAPRGRPQAGRSRIAKLVEAYEAHPVHACPDADDHLRVAARLREAEAEKERIAGRMRGRRDTIARSFERVLGVLGELGYVDGWALTPKGELLSAVYNESDLLVVECLRRGWLAGLDPDELAAVASMFVYEARGRDEPESAPTPQLSRYARRVLDLYTSLSKEERRHDVELLKAPETGFMAQVYEWAQGSSLEDVLTERDGSAGDFVRWAKQVVDLLQQLRQIASPDSELAVTTKEAIARVQRGVVAYSSIV
jgi:ATP-dependent RNA helicase HelY